VSDPHVMSQYHSFVIMLGGAGTTRPAYCVRWGRCVDAALQFMNVWGAK